MILGTHCIIWMCTVASGISRIWIQKRHDDWWAHAVTAATSSRWTCAPDPVQHRGITCPSCSSRSRRETWQTKYWSSHELFRVVSLTLWWCRRAVRSVSFVRLQFPFFTAQWIGDYFESSCSLGDWNVSLCVGTTCCPLRCAASWFRSAASSRELESLQVAQPCRCICSCTEHWNTVEHVACLLGLGGVKFSLLKLNFSFARSFET